MSRSLLGAIALFGAATAAYAATYEVGSGKPYTSIGAVPWATLQPGDLVLIHWRSTPYKEKWVICRQGTSTAPIVVRGVPNGSGQLPVIEGNGAVTPRNLDFYSEERGVLKIGGASVPSNLTPRYITVENLEIRGARNTYSFLNASGNTQAYKKNAAAVYIEKGENLTLRNCVLRDSGNGLFISSPDGSPTRNILLEGNYLLDNGYANSTQEHNSYTTALGITFQNNRYGPLRAGSQGMGIKDRSAGVVIRYNWIEGGSRELDLVDTDDPLLNTDPRYDETHVYGNVLVEPAGAGNRQIIHYGGDSGNTNQYRRGTLYLYQNTVISLRTDRTTLLRLSSNSESADVRNNILYTTAAGSTLQIIDNSGRVTLNSNWSKPGWLNCYCTPTGTVTQAAPMVTGASPGFVNEGGQDYRVTTSSAAINAGAVLHPAVLSAHPVSRQYVKHQSTQARPQGALLDLGAFESVP